MTDPTTPSVNPPNLGNLTGVFKEVFRKLLENTDDMLPAKIISYDRGTGRAKVQPLIVVVKTDGSQQIRNETASIPVLHLGGGGFMIDFPLNPGDLGWIKANDRDISLFLQQYVQSPPNIFTYHNFSSAVFIPDVMKGYTINSEDDDNVVLSTIDGTQRVAIWSDRVKMTSGGSSITIQNAEITIDTPLLTVTGEVNGTGTRGMGASYVGTIHATVDVTAQTVSLHGHVHIDGGGTGDSGPPAT